MTDTAPSFLRVQAAKAKARAHLAISQAKQAGTWEPTPDDDHPLHQAPSQTPNNQPASPRAPAQKPPEKPQVPRTQAKPSSVPAKGKSQQHANKGKSAPTNGFGLTRVVYNDDQVAQMLDTLDPLAVVDLFKTHAPNSAAFEIAAPHLPTVMAAILAGAQIRGAQGNADRMTLFRMLGAPWTPVAQSGGSSGGGRGGDVEALTDRFVRAVARVEQRLARRGLVAAAPPDIDGTAVEAEAEA